MKRLLITVIIILGVMKLMSCSSKSSIEQQKRENTIHLANERLLGIERMLNRGFDESDRNIASMIEIVKYSAEMGKSDDMIVRKADYLLKRIDVIKESHEK